MRLATCALALALATTTATTQIADACGGSYGLDLPPQVMLVSDHVRSSHRAFVILGDRAGNDDDGSYERLAPMTYDYTLIKELEPLAHAMTFTLVGTHGRRVVSADRHVALKHVLWSHGSHVDGMEVAVNEDFAIALHGDVRDATWHVSEYARGRHVLPFGITATSNKEGGYTVRVGTRSLGTHAGALKGLLEMNGKRYIVMKNGTQTSLVTVPAQARS